MSDRAGFAARLLEREGALVAAAAPGPERLIAKVNAGEPQEAAPSAITSTAKASAG